MTLSWRDLDRVADELEAYCPAEVAPLYRPRWNVAPSDAHLVLRRTGAHPRQLELGNWGFLRDQGSGLLINARAETAASRPSFRAAFSDGRCVIPADGFYEWSGKGPERRPHWLHRSDGRLLLLAGLCQRAPARDPGGADGGLRFTVLTTAANRMVATLHDRMPVILEPGDVDRWLAEGPRDLLRPAPEVTLADRPVSRRANSVSNDDPACLDPPAEEPAEDAPAPTGRRQLSLF